MAGSKGGGGGGKGGSVTPPPNQYSPPNQYGGGNKWYNPQPQTPYNPMMDVYGSGQNVMQPMPGYYNQFPAGGSNYRPYQPQPQPEPPPDYNPTPMPPGPIGGQGGHTGFPIGLEPGTDFNNYNMNDIATAVNRSQFGDYYPVYRNEPEMKSTTEYFNPELAQPQMQIMGNNRPVQRDFSQAGRGLASHIAPPQFAATRTRPDGRPVGRVGMPILDAADRRGGKGRDSGPRSGYVKYNQNQPVVSQDISMDEYLSNLQRTGGSYGTIAPPDNPGFGGYDQNARAMMYGGAPSSMFRGFR